MRMQAQELEGDELKSFLDSSVTQMLSLLDGKRK